MTNYIEIRKEDAVKILQHLKKQTSMLSRNDVEEIMDLVTIIENKLI